MPFVIALYENSHILAVKMLKTSDDASITDSANSYGDTFVETDSIGFLNTAYDGSLEGATVGKQQQNYKSLRREIEIAGHHFRFYGGTITINFVR